MVPFEWLQGKLAACLPSTTFLGSEPVFKRRISATDDKPNSTGWLWVETCPFVQPLISFAALFAQMVRPVSEESQIGEGFTQHRCWIDSQPIGEYL